VDFNGDGKRDLLNSVEDAIGSIGNYLKVHGWQRGSLVAEPWVDAETQATQVTKLVRDSLKPTISPQALKKLGFSADTVEPVSVMQFDGSAGLETWVGYGNFYAITRYNHSSMYALAVHQLSQALR
jgi:membrane-bound lytic murein transglycosylase B